MTRYATKVLLAFLLFMLGNKKYHARAMNLNSSSFIKLQSHKELKFETRNKISSKSDDCNEFENMNCTTRNLVYGKIEAETNVEYDDSRNNSVIYGVMSNEDHEQKNSYDDKWKTIVEYLLRPFSLVADQNYFSNNFTHQNYFSSMKSINAQKEQMKTYNKLENDSKKKDSSFRFLNTSLHEVYHNEFEYGSKTEIPTNTRDEAYFHPKKHKNERFQNNIQKSKELSNIRSKVSKSNPKMKLTFTKDSNDVKVMDEPKKLSTPNRIDKILMKLYPELKKKNRNRVFNEEKSRVRAAEESEKWKRMTNIIIDRLRNPSANLELKIKNISDNYNSIIGNWTG